MSRSTQRILRVTIVGLVVGALSALWWLPAPLNSRLASRMAPRTVHREVTVGLSKLLSGMSPGSFTEDGRGGVRASRGLRSRPVLLCPGIHFTAFGVAWSQGDAGSVSASLQTGPSSRRLGPSSSIQAEDAGPDLGTRDARHPTVRATDPVWVGDAQCARFTLELSRGSDISNVRAVFMNTLGTAFGGRPVLGLAEAGTAPATAPLAGLIGPSAAEAWAYRPRIITRAHWGADENLRNCGPDYSPRVKMAFVHHTDNPNNYSPGQSAAIVRSIYWYHTQVMKWCDIAYNFLVDRYGQVFEGRYGGMTLPIIPAATRGFNFNSTAVAAIGNFMIAQPPSAMLNAIDRVLAWRLDVAHVSPVGKAWMKNRAGDIGKFKLGQWVLFNDISGHRDANYTDCPGDWLYAKFRAIRTAVFSIGLPKIFNPRESPAHFVYTQGIVTWTANASARMRWNLNVLDSENNVVDAWWTRGTSFSVTWNGYTRGGDPVPPGTYTVKLLAWNGSGKARGADFTLTIDPIPSPSPSPSPSS